MTHETAMTMAIGEGHGAGSRQVACRPERRRPAGRTARARAALPLRASAWGDACLAGMGSPDRVGDHAFAGGWTHHAVPATGVARPPCAPRNEFLWLLAVPLLAHVPAAFLLLWTILP